MENKVLILGSGFLGAQIKKDFGNQVIGVSRSGEGDLNLDLTLESSYSKLPRDIDYVIFAVSPDSSSTDSYQIAYIEILNLSLEFAKKLSSLKKYIFVSSTGVYGVDNGSWVDELTIPDPIKATSKIIMQAENLMQTSGLKHVILRFGGIYGAGRYRMIEVAKAGNINLKEKEFSNRIHVEDCSNLIKFSIDNLEGTFIGVDCAPCDKNEVILWIREQLNLDKNMTEINATKIKGKRCSNKKILDLGFNFLYPSYKEGYQQILQNWNR